MWAKQVQSAPLPRAYSWASKVPLFLRLCFGLGFAHTSTTSQYVCAPLYSWNSPTNKPYLSVHYHSHHAPSISWGPLGWVQRDLGHGGSCGYPGTPHEDLESNDRHRNCCYEADYNQKAYGASLGSTRGGAASKPKDIRISTGWPWGKPVAVSSQPAAWSMLLTNLLYHQGLYTKSPI